MEGSGGGVLQTLWQYVVFDSVNATYFDFKSNFAKRLSAEVPVASSPITTRKHTYTNIVVS
ncbi:hypothetical protein P7K49_004744 [Saguinus oedipus]|uniref:Uncharacterized protein n=1 Tax=Saguinus oedipus TaxID=9490 RepID=A0ABQ9W8A2_SAGOE|nr:hypothetical protein P7K49_004744 [Saguinus oedipus]